MTTALVTAKRERKRQLMSLKDEDLLRELYDYALRAIPDDNELDGRYCLITEAGERWTPVGAWVERVRQLRADGLEHEIHDTRLGWLDDIGERMQLAEEAA